MRPDEATHEGRGNLSEQALFEFIEWFCKLCRDQLQFVSKLFDFKRLRERLFSRLSPARVE